jgi:hypothetical protein
MTQYGMMPSKTDDVGVKFRFRSPLHDVIEQQKGQKFLEMKQILAEAVAMDPAVAYVPDVLAPSATRSTASACRRVGSARVDVDAWSASSRRSRRPDSCSSG